MLNRRKLLVATTALATSAVASTMITRSAAASQPFSREAFQSAQAAGRPILVEVWASWCPTCARQAPIIEQLSKDPRFSGVTILRIDFDRQRDVLRELRVLAQSTLIVYRGAEERGRSVGVTDPGQIRGLVERVL